MMTSKDDRPGDADPSRDWTGSTPAGSGQALRRRAEERAGENTAQMPENLEAMSPEATRKLLHELRVHQIELEMQNEDLRHAQAELGASQARYFDLYDLAPVGYVTISEKGLILEANLTAVTLLGVARGALVKQPFSLFILNEDQDLYYRHRKQLFETLSASSLRPNSVQTGQAGEPHTFELRMLRQDSAPFWARLEATAAQDPSTSSGQASDGTPVCRVVLSDITERKEIEEAIIESSNFLTKVINAIADPVFVKDREHRWILLNDSLCSFMGHSSRELIGKSDYDFFPVGEADVFRQKDEEVFTSGIENENEEQFTDAKGATHTIITKKSRYVDVSGHQFLVGVIRDITERKQVEEALRETHDFLENLLDYANAPIIVWDSQFKITRFNRAFERLTGRKSSDVLGLALDFLFPLEKRTESLEYIQQTSTGERWKTVEIPFQDVDGSDHTLLWNSATLCGADGKTVVATIAQGHDITEWRQAQGEQRKLEAQLAKAQKMEAIGTLAGGIAHDFNNILGIISGFTEISLSETSRTTPLGQNLEQVMKAANRAKNLVQQILSFGRKTQTEQITLNASPIIKEALSMLRASLPTTIEICTDIEATCEVQADPTQVHQVVVNLCTNAAHAMKEEGGIVQISLGKVDFDASVPHPDLSAGPYIKLSVSDTGKGMTPEVVGRIFDPFFTTKGPDEGTGLGLSVVYSIVRSHQGAITVDSEPGKGSTFNVFLPRIEIRDAFEPEIVVQPPIGEEQILFVDDERALADLGQLMLEALGYKVESFASSLEALKAFEAQPNRFDLVITDMTMPHMTGVKLAKEVMRLRPQIPVILCSGFSDLITPEKAREMGIKTMLIKPVSLAKLAKTVRQILDDMEK